MNRLIGYSRIHLNTNNSNPIFIKDPIHGMINFSSSQIWLYKLINTLEFQRLNYIKQLSISYLNFPSALHTRYAHSLGVFELVNRFIKHFIENKFLSETENKFEINIALAAALLHDIGHGPLSHVLEKTVPNFNHEEMGIRIIKCCNTKINQLLREKATEDQKPPQFYVEEIVSVINRSSKYRWIVDLISSNVDADRLDFLLRDSYHSGVTYGNQVDVNILIKGSVIKNGRMMFLLKAKNHLEQFFLARRHMYKDLYCNKPSFFYENMLVETFVYIKSNIDKFSKVEVGNSLSFFGEESTDGNLIKFLRLTDEVFLNRLEKLLNIDDIHAKRYRYCLFGIGDDSYIAGLKDKYLDSHHLQISDDPVSMELLDYEDDRIVRVNI